MKINSRQTFCPRWKENKRGVFQFVTGKKRIIQLLCQPLKKGALFLIWYVSLSSTSDAFKIETEQGQLLQRSRVGCWGEDKYDPVEHNSRRATVKEKQTEHMALLWCWLTLPYDTIVFMKTLLLALQITCCTASSEVLKLQCWSQPLLHFLVLVFSRKSSNLGFGMENLCDSFKLWNSRLIYCKHLAHMTGYQNYGLNSMV